MLWVRSPSVSAPSEIEHVLATQCLLQQKSETFEIRIDGTLPYGVTAKDIILSIIGHIGIDGGNGAVVEYTGSAIRALSIEERMTVCNMSIEAGARAGMIAPDDATYEYHRWQTFRTERTKTLMQQSKIGSNSRLTKARPTTERYNSTQQDIAPQVTWGTNPGMVTDVTGRVPDPADMTTTDDKRAAEHALAYMDLQPGTPITDIPVDRVFIGSCTNSRISDLRAAAEVAKGRKVAERVSAMVVPGSQAVKRQAEAEGLDEVFREAGFEWREAGCSMCLGMNPDTLMPGQRCASTSNRNFEGRQGKGGRTHLVSPQMAAATAVTGHFVDIRKFQ